ncbi:hypothetical protein GB937_009655 [Aspergillus fischeri]|nr:hypothetical protein GB937_009655 [Aspergillus fischeri]
MCKNELPFTNEYTWVCEFNEENKIIKIRAYMDTNKREEAEEQKDALCSNPKRVRNPRITQLLSHHKGLRPEQDKNDASSSTRRVIPLMLRLSHNYQPLTQLQQTSVYINSPPAAQPHRQPLP